MGVMMKSEQLVLEHEQPAKPAQSLWLLGWSMLEEWSFNSCSYPMVMEGAI